MICVKHGESGAPINGKCRRCFQQEVIEEISKIAREFKGEKLASGQKPFIYAPLFLLNPRDFPWLWDKTVDDETVQLIREVLAHTYILHTAHLFGLNKGLEAGSYINFAIDFRPKLNHWTLWQIHYQAANWMRELPAGKAIIEHISSYPKAELPGNDDIFFLAGIACHLEIGLRHLALVTNLDTYEKHQEMANFSTEFLNQIISTGYFEIKGDNVLGKGRLESGPLEKFVSLIVPGSAQVLPDGRLELYNMTIKALNDAKKNNDIRMAERMYEEAILLAPERSEHNRAEKMRLLYEYGVFSIRKSGYQYLHEVSRNPAENNDLFRVVRDYWREALSLFLSLSAETIRSHSYKLRDAAETIQDDLIAANLLTPALEVTGLH